MQIPSAAIKALDLLENAGFEAFVVGGCVRDSLLQKNPNDWDITTNALPEETKRVFCDYKVIETGIKHGTVAVLLDDELLEITTYRVDGDYLDNRHPSTVEFTRNLKDDLARRDFTINAMACNKNGELMDEFAGMEDLSAGIIRCVGEPDKRFLEDALRIMRALRFSSTLDFDIEDETSKSIFKNAHLLENVSKERITEELLKLLCGTRVTKVLIEYRDVFGVIIPELKPCFDFDQRNRHHIYNVYDHMAYSVGAVEPIPDVRLALLLHDIGKPETFTVDENGVGHFFGHADKCDDTIKSALGRLCLSNELYFNVFNLIKYHYYPIEANKKIIRRRLNKFGPDLLKKLMIVKLGDNAAHNLETGDFEPEIKEIMALIDEVENDCYEVRNLAINGDDLISLGLKGPMIGKTLEKLLLEVMNEELPNEHDKLIERVKELGTSKA